MQQINDKKLTIIIPTKDRPDKLKRILLYAYAKDDYEKFDYMILDSSNAENKLKAMSYVSNFLIKYKSYNQDINVFDKIKDGARYIKTPYVMICGDDDFYISENIIKLLEKTNLKDEAYTGKTLSIKLVDNKTIWYYPKNYLNLFYSIMPIENFTERINKTRPTFQNIENERIFTAGIYHYFVLNKITYVRETHAGQDSSKLGGNEHFLGKLSNNIKELLPSDALQFIYYNINNQAWIAKEIKKVIW